MAGFEAHERAHHHCVQGPFPGVPVHYLPNLITLLRLLLVLPTGWCLLRGLHNWALTLFAVAAVSDAIDGWLARRFDWTSRFGAIADPLADKLLVLVAYLALAVMDVLPLWLVLIVLGRDLLIVLGASAFHVFVAELTPEPSWLGKGHTLANLLFLGAILLLLAAPALGSVESLVAYGGPALAVLTVLSGADYVRAWTFRALRA